MFRQQHRLRKTHFFFLPATLFHRLITERHFGEANCGTIPKTALQISQSLFHLQQQKTLPNPDRNHSNSHYLNPTPSSRPIVPHGRTGPVLALAVRLVASDAGRVRHGMSDVVLVVHPAEEVGHGPGGVHPYVLAPVGRRGPGNGGLLLVVLVGCNGMGN